MQVEIGDPPSDNRTSSSSVSPQAKLSVNDLKAISSNLSEMAQDGSLSDVLNASVVGVGVSCLDAINACYSAMSTLRDEFIHRT